LTSSDIWKISDFYFPEEKTQVKNTVSPGSHARVLVVQDRVFSGQQWWAKKRMGDSHNDLEWAGLQRGV
jgi:hypothetical protein